MQRAGRRICGWVRLFLLRRSADRRRLLPRHRWRTEVRRYDCKIKDNVKDARLKRKSRQPLQIQLRRQSQLSRRDAGGTKSKTGLAGWVTGEAEARSGITLWAYVGSI